MRPLAAFAGQSLTWVQPQPIQREYELRAGQVLIASLRWQKPSGSLALAQAADGAWTFKRTGFFSPQVTVRVPGAEANLAGFRPSWGGSGVLECTDGHKYSWMNTSFWGCEWVFSNPFGSVLVHVRPEVPPVEQPGNKRLMEVARARIEPSAAADPHLSHLVLLSWYLLVLMADDAAVMTGAV
jgi:hypothetical protein